MSTHRSAVSVYALCALAAAAAWGPPSAGGASGADAQERARPKNDSEQQREDSLNAERARKSGEMGTRPSSSDLSGQMPTSSTNPVQRIQAALKAHGHDPGPIDGVMGRRTQEALRAYQAAQHLNATGQIDQKTLDKLGVQPAARHP